MRVAPFEPRSRQEALIRFDAKPSLDSNSTPVAAIRIDGVTQGAHPPGRPREAAAVFLAKKNLIGLSIPPSLSRQDIETPSLNASCV
jgi:hypothetical protein